MITTIRDETPRARKPHRCQLCGRSIAVGERYHSQFNADGGESWMWRECAHCSAVVQTLWNRRFDLEEINGFTVFDWLRESGDLALMRLAVGMKRQWRGFADGMMPIPAIPPRLCVDCREPVDAPRNYTWCARHDAERIERVSRQFDEIERAFA